MVLVRVLFREFITLNIIYYYYFLLLFVILLLFFIIISYKLRN